MDTVTRKYINKIEHELLLTALVMLVFLCLFGFLIFGLVHRIEGGLFGSKKGSA